MADAPSTPKRKRAGQQEEVPATPIKFSLNPANADSPTHGNHSPRTNVALRFRGLALGGGADAAAEPGVTADLFVRKRTRSDLTMADLDAAAPDPQPVAARPEPDGLSRPLPWPRPDVAMASTEAAGSSSSNARPVVDCPPEPKSPGRRRAGTPPLRLKHSPAKASGDRDVEVSVADPVRAALTWHDDEITVYDPDDADDDGTGINGIGFKPTPELAHARSMTRRQQVVDYRRREESEARAKRNQRRRGDAAVPSGRVVKKKSPARKVRFMDAESQKFAVETA